MGNMAHNFSNTFQQFKIILSEKPSTPSLEAAGKPVVPTSRSVSVKEGSTMNATCAVVGGRPKPKLSWILRKPSTNLIGELDKEATEDMTVEDEENDEGRF